MNNEKNALELALHLFRMGELIQKMDEKINGENDPELRRIYINEREDMYSRQIDMVHKLRSLGL